MLLSVVSPVYKADTLLPKLVELISAECEALDGAGYEIILVNDASPDNSWAVITGLCQANKKVTGVNLSRNFGQHAAINAGLSIAKGDYIIVMDCDLQHHPKYIPQLLAKAKEGYDIVLTATASRKHSFFKNMASKIYHGIYNYLAELDGNYNFSTYSIISAKVLQHYKKLKDQHSHYLPKLRWLGFKQAVLQTEHFRRPEGRSSYSLKKLFAEALNGISSHSVKLLRLNIFLGIILSLASFIGIIYIVAIYFTRGFLVGWASIATMILFSLGILLTSIGVLGLYLGQTFEQVKDRPNYVIDHIYNQS